MQAEQRIGMVGLDTSHVISCARVFNDSTNPHHVSGARIVCGWPGGSEDFKLSSGRVEGYTRQLQEEFGVEVLETPEAVAEACDILFIMSCDGRVHRTMFERTVGYKKPTFIDKPFTCSVADAEAILKLAVEKDVPLMSTSSVRFADNVQQALKDPEGQGALVGCDACGPLSIEPPIPDYFWYGVHTVELIVAAMGPGCRRLQAVRRDAHDVIWAEWQDGRMAAIHGVRDAHSGFGLTLHREKGFTQVDLGANARPNCAALMQAIMNTLPQGRSAVPHAETLEVVRILEAAGRSRSQGVPVDMAP